MPSKPLLRRAATLAACWLVALSAQAQTPTAPEPDARPPTPSEPAPPKPAVPAPSPPSPAPLDPTPPSVAPGAPTAPAVAAPVIPPTLLESVPPTYPSALLGSGRESTVELFVTIAANGNITEIVVAVSGGAEFDAAASDAVHQWRFKPAEQNGKAVASRIRIPLRFLPPAASEAAPVRAASPKPAEPLPRDPSATPGGGASSGPSEPEPSPTEVAVHGRKAPRTEVRSASDFRIGRDVLRSAPRSEGAEILRAAPGVTIGRGEGAAVAHRYSLRGFDADHGQDIEFRVGGLPINLPSHIHGQGYSDLGFLISEGVSELQVSEGVYDPRQGDFAVAGSIDVLLGVGPDERGVRLSSGYGSFDTFRELALWAPADQADETFGAVEFVKTSGFGQNRASQRGNAILQGRFGEGPLTWRALGILTTARGDHAGVLRKDDVDAGRVCFECVYPEPTARAQNALAERLVAGLFADYFGEAGSNGQFGFWLGADDFRLQENFTGFIQRSQTLPDTSGRGDLIEQQNRTLSLGLTGRYKSAPYAPFSWAKGTMEVGLDGRLDGIEQAQNLLEALRNETWDRRVDARIQSADLGVWGDLDWRVAKMVTLRGGVRADVLSYDVEDRLGNFIELSRPADTFIVGFRRSAAGVAAGPRASVEVRPFESFGVLAAYGEGFRSPQARTLEDGEPTPFAKVRSADVGVHFDFRDLVHASLGGYYTHLSSDVAFSAAEGRQERVGATQRLGAVAHAVTHPTDWLVGSLSFTYVDARLLEPPPPTAEDPDPPFATGQALPYVPPVVVRADIGGRRVLVEHAAGLPLGAKAGLGFSFLAPRPLPYGELAEPVGLLDGTLGAWWGPLDLSFEVFNLANSRYAAVEYQFASDWDPGDGVQPRTPARHTSAGAPLSWLVSLGVTL